MQHFGAAAGITMFGMAAAGAAPHGMDPRMKVNIEIDCTPQEARAFFGLPDLAPMQEAVMAQVQERMLKALAGMDPETLLKSWMPLGMQGMEQMQKFWQQFTSGAGRGGKSGGNA
jgi:hypothetical protein